MTETITIGGRELPMRRTLAAMRKFDEKYKGEISILEFGQKSMRVDHITSLLFLFIEAGYKAEGKQIDIDQEWIEDNADMADFEQLASRLTSVDAGQGEGEKKT